MIVGMAGSTQAVENFKKIVEQAPVLAKAGKLQEAGELLQQLNSLGGCSIIQKKTLAGVFQQLHDELDHRGEVGLLYKLDEHARSLFPTEKQAGVNFAQACISKGNFEAAANILKEAAKQSNSYFAPGPNPDARLNFLLAQASLVLNKIDDAKAAIEKAITADPADAQNHYTKAQIMMRAQKWDEVSKSSVLAFKLNPKLAQPVDYLVRASCHQREGEFDQAQKVIEDALSRYPTAPGLHYSLGQVFQGKRQAAPAFYQYQYEIMLTGPQSSYTNDAKDQIEIMTALLTKEKNPDNYLKVAYGAAALMNMKPGSYEKAIENIKKGLRANGDNCLPLQALLGHAYMGLGKYEDAAKAFEAALFVDSFFVPAYVDLGDMYQKLDKKDKAFEQYGKAMTLDKLNWRVKEMLQKVDAMKVK